MKALLTLLTHIRANIGVTGGLPGLSVASPSTEQPDYWYHWIRDGAIATDTLIEAWADSRSDELAELIEAYIGSSRILQGAANLGEPKFYIDGVPFTGPWGRPQNDGPALRALVVAKWASHQDLETQLHLYESCLRQDAMYVAENWSQDSFDLWEETEGQHYFTLAMQWGALKAASVVADRLGQKDSANLYRNELFALGSVLEKFPFCEHNPCFLANRGGSDTATVLAALELESLARWTEEFDNIPLVANVTSTRVTVAARIMETDGMFRFPINNHRLGGVGRYPEDVYDGIGTSQGHPWFLCTAALAELWVRNGEYELAAPHFAFIGRHRGRNGSMSEQADRTTGIMRGARDLTWSYTAVYRAVQAALDAGRPDLAELTEPPVATGKWRTPILRAVSLFFNI